MRRVAALLLALTAVLWGVSASPAAADGPVGDSTDILCEVGMGPIGGPAVDAIAGYDVCEEIGDTAEEKMKEEWEEIKNSLLGDFIKSIEDVAKWTLKKTLTVALLGPSVDLEATGLFGEDATLAGMLVWLGWVIAAFGLMWQLGKMAVTGQMKYAGQALLGWVQNALLTGIGLTIVASLLQLGDAMTVGLVESTFGGDEKAVNRIVGVMLPGGVANPVMLLGVVVVLLIVGFCQLVLVFLRQSAIPIQCLLLPIAGAGRMGGEATRQWAPRLITSILVVIAYKPILAIIICAGFAEFGHSQTLSEWLRGLATLVLGVLAPGPLTKLFAPFGAEVGGGLAVGGALGAVAGVGGGAMGGAGSSSGGGSAPSGGGVPSPRSGGSAPPEGDGSPSGDAMKHAQYVEQSMGRYGGQNSQGEGSSGGDVAVQASSTDVTVKSSAPAAGTGAGAEAGAAAAGTGGAAAAAGPVGLAIEVLDGINGAVQRGADTMGGGDKQ